MPIKEKAEHILAELKGHAPFTLLGSFLGIVFMLMFRNSSDSSRHMLFSIFHPAHVVLSAMVTASMFKIHAIKKNLVLIIIVGYTGSIGIATLSDIIIPHFAGELLGFNSPTHEQLHQHTNMEEHETRENNIHLGFIEEWYIVNPAAVLGIFIAFYLPRTKFPHSAHVLVSTWASSSYLLMSIGSQITVAAAIGIFATLFIATWLPCCVSDIVFPLLFVKSDLRITGSCRVHRRHSHEHTNQESS